MALHDYLLFLVTSCVLASEGLYASGSTISEPVESALFVRSKRDDGRAMTFSGFLPYGGMTTYASAGDWGQWYRGQGHGQRRPVVFNEQGWKQPQTPAEPEGDSSPEITESTWKDEQPNSHGVNKEDERPSVSKKPKKKPTTHKEKSSEEEEEQDDTHVPNRNSGGNAAASFNAWFPIMLGMFPQEDGASSYGSSSRKSPPQTSVVANSVSHGPGGVASSHAVAYGGLPEHLFRSRN